MTNGSTGIGRSGRRGLLSDECKNVGASAADDQTLAGPEISRRSIPTSLTASAHASSRTPPPAVPACYKGLPSLLPRQNAKNPFPIVVKLGSTLDGRALLDYKRGAQSPIGCARRDGLRAAGGDACHRKDPQAYAARAMQWCDTARRTPMSPDKQRRRTAP
jgi:hypothetical protein